MNSEALCMALTGRSRIGLKECPKDTFPDAQNRRIRMDKEFTESMRVSLTTMKQEILDKLAATNAEFRAIVEEMDPKDFADVASDDVDRKMIEALGSQDMKRLRSIEAALVRLQQGRYGSCMKCSKRIPRERLEALPYAVMCIDCQKSEERRNR
jgi:RNA polymerase-binding protein DksA